MLRNLCWIAFVMTAFWPISAQVASRSLGLNDVTWLRPVPQTAVELKKVISIDTLKTKDDIPVLSDEQFVDVLKASGRRRGFC